MLPQNWNKKNKRNSSFVQSLLIVYVGYSSFAGDTLNTYYDDIFSESIMKKYFCSNHCRQRTLCAVPSRVLLCLKPAPMTYILKMATCSDYSTRLAVHYIYYISERKTWFLSFSKKDLSSCTGTSPVIMLLWRSLPPRFCWYFQRIPDDKTYLNLCWKLHSSNFKLEDDVCRNILLTF